LNNKNFNNLWYKTIRALVHNALIFYFRKIQVVGKENIPIGKPILFVANHRNGFIDPVLIATSPMQVLHFLTRASAFKNPIVNFLLRSIKMIPIYRIRDGLDSIAKNQEVFEACNLIFSKNGSILIFPEGNHGFPRSVRTLSKGFTRIAFGFLDHNPQQGLYIVPVGINYSNISKAFEKVSIHYGKPFMANDFYDSSISNLSIEKLKTKVFEELKTLTTHIENIEKHDLIEKTLLKEGLDFTNPLEANARVAALEKVDLSLLETASKSMSVQVSKSIFQKIISFLFKLNSIFPLLIWRKIKLKIKDVVMRATARFGVSVGLFFLFYILQSLIILFFFGWKIGFIYLVISFILVYIRKYN
jgi:1-acyl-sn-glycerol-3-phosphate acyltransferase